jgi:hypothetical protein
VRKEEQTSSFSGRYRDEKPGIRSGERRKSRLNDRKVVGGRGGRRG